MIEFALEPLGWRDFENLCHSIAREVLGQTVEKYLAQNDAGRDGAFTGLISGESLPSGRYVIQCKHSQLANSRITLSDLTDEVMKAERLVVAGRCDVYILMTNAGVSGRSVAAMEDAFAAVGATSFICFGRDWINQTIAENPRLRMLVPRLYGLGDLTQILDERAYRQAGSILQSMRTDLAKVVRTGSYERSAEALRAHGFVLLLGEPAAGKTTIAAQLALAGIDALHTSLVKLDDAAEIGDRWNPDEPRQLFWIDDAFGATQFEVDLARAWARTAPRMQAAINDGARIVVTSRDYIFEAARPHLKAGAFPLLQESQVVVDVHDLSIEERKQILYNHLKHGSQPRSFLRRVVPFLDGVAERPSFSPELARRFAQPTFTKNIGITSEDLNNFFDRPEAFLREVIEGLDVHSRAAMGLIYLHEGFLLSPISMTESDQEFATRMGSDLGEIVAALRHMAGSIVAHRYTDESSGWSFAHPTMIDVYADLLRADPELLTFYLQVAPLESILRTVTCGDVGILGAVRVSRALYPVLRARLVEPLATRWQAARSDKELRTSFLAHRCDHNFLAAYVEGHSALLEYLGRPGLMIDAVPETALAVRLHEEDLLPEPIRKAFVATVTDYFVEGRDGAALSNSAVRRMFDDSEIERIRDRIREDLVKTVEDAVELWTEDYEAAEPPSDYIDPLRDLLNTALTELDDDPEVTRAFEDAFQLIEDFVYGADYSEHEPDYDYDVGQGDDGDESDDDSGVDDDVRSIFDDLVGPA